jgi:twitching motility protein PilU
MKDNAHLSLSQNLLTIFSQKLLSSEKKGRVMAIEVLKNTGLIRNHISEGKLGEINSIMERVSDPAIRTMDAALFDLYKTGDISQEVALHEAENPSNLRLKMSQKLGSIQTKTDTNNQF